LQLVFNLVNNIDLPETRARFEVHKLQQVLDSQERENAYWVEEAEEEEADYFDPLDSPQSRLIDICGMMSSARRVLANFVMRVVGLKTITLGNAWKALVIL
jgi:hypothetical protein